MKKKKEVNHLTKKGLKQGQKRLVMNDLTPTEKEILILLTREYLTPKKISIKRQTSIQAVSKHIRNLKKKGYLKKNLTTNIKVNQKRPTTQPNATLVNQIRLHGQEFNIRILYNNDSYRKRLRGCNVINVDGNTVRLYKNSVEVYSGQSFYGVSVQGVTVKSFEYWNGFFSRLENDLGVVLFKGRCQNVRLVNQHYAEIGNEFADEVEKKGVKVNVFGTDDGRLWFTIDNSFNFGEAECLHPESAKQDMERVVGFFNDLRDNPVPNMSEVLKVLKELAELNRETAEGLNAVSEVLKVLLPSVKKEDVGSGVFDYVG